MFLSYDVCIVKQTFKLVAAIPTIELQLTIAELYKNVSKLNHKDLFFEFVYISITGNVAYINKEAYQNRNRCGLIFKENR